ncbi:cyclic pyranopterin monophosphate synthase MoaC [Clostridium estertheticum]|uniref:Cyclic pyranopterin monophosphate synthase n=1 Tax=Clostridium estertheticum TaxID=238834 RepID=A0AA47EFL5_9CLOT|nr:cyclic pyranopterin monophosphate synthase MoaC [Clostridium estertheticum]MBU3156550.1 hypothetical protein [Clostridium estertheticum]WAG59311.1 hypothetical protein LL038_16910 [Clostridium estertheticum]
MEKFSHFNMEGHARMVDFGDKADTHRTAVASGRVLMNPHTLEHGIEILRDYASEYASIHTSNQKNDKRS